MQRVSDIPRILARAALKKFLLLSSFFRKLFSMTPSCRKFWQGRHKVWHDDAYIFTTEPEPYDSNGLGIYNQFSTPITNPN